MSKQHEVCRSKDLYLDCTIKDRLLFITDTWIETNSPIDTKWFATISLVLVLLFFLPLRLAHPRLLTMFMLEEAVVVGVFFYFAHSSLQPNLCSTWCSYRYFLYVYYSPSSRCLHLSPFNLNYLFCIHISLLCLQFPDFKKIHSYWKIYFK